MTLIEKLLKKFEDLPEDKKMEVIDFIEFLKTKDKRKVENMMDTIIEENREALEELSK
jgi:hypothetical protein